MGRGRGATPPPLHSSANGVGADRIDRAARVPFGGVSSPRVARLSLTLRGLMADKSGKPGLYERPPDVGKWQSFKTFLWNGETSQLLGRTFASWGE